MVSKTVDQIRTELVEAFLQRLPNLDLTDGTPERDIFIESPIAGQLITLWDAIIYVSKTFAPILYYSDLDIDDVKTYMANYNVTVNPATYSNGTVTFYTYTEPTTDIVIPEGTIVKTDSSTPIDFSVDGTYTIYSAISNSYYNPILNRWEINCSVKAVLAGPNYRAGANSVINIATSINGIQGCTNENAISGGQPEETLESALRRVIEKFQGRGLSSTQGLISYVGSYVTAVNVVGAEDPEMLRDEGYGGCVDIYVIGSDSTNYTD
ncbi:MAG TPA: baseplate J/gp47 family protein, partial [Methanofastidiosum sp.]|nr:baseplate J/gp47 family protein [Methanofastidiosum sp.]